MTEQKKHWWEVGRVKSSDWFRGLSALEKDAALAALEQDTHESAVKLRAALALIYCTILCAAAFAFWAGFFRFSVIWFSIGGSAFGLICGILPAIAIVRQRTPAQAAAMQTRVGTVLGFPSVLLAIAGAVAWLGRSILFG